MFTRSLLLSALLAFALPFVVSSPAEAQQQYGIGITDRADTAPQGTVASCQGASGNVLQAAYNGIYAGSDGTQFALIIQGQSLVVFVMRNNAKWLEGAANTGPSSTSLNVPLTAPNGDRGTLTLCATHLTTDGFCSRLGVGLIVNNTLDSGPEIFVRNHTPDVGYCVKSLADKPSPKALAEFERAKDELMRRAGVEG